MSTLWQDVRYGLRMLARSPGFTAIVVFTLALGIGANTAIFSFLDRVFLRPLPVKKPHELVTLKHRSETGYVGDAFVYPLYIEFRDQSQEAFSGLIAYKLDIVDVSIENSEKQTAGMAVSSNYFTVLGMKPVLGRTFLPEEDQPHEVHPVAVISHGVWQRQFDGDPAVLGKTIRLNDYPLTVVGVAASEFTGTLTGANPAVYVPLSTWAYINDISLDRRFYDWLCLLGRLKPGVSRDQAQANLQVLAKQIHSVEPTNTPTGIIVEDGSRGTNWWREESLWWPFALIQAITALILVVACANVTNLLLARGTTRQKEFAIRSAIGASRGAVIRQLLAESTLLALLSGACGVLLAQWLTEVLRGALRVASAFNIPVDVDGRVLVFGLLMSLATALACGLVPALRASRPNLMSALKDDTGTIKVLTRRWNLRNLLVVTQVAVTMIMLAFGMLCVRSLGKLHVADPGFDPARILAVSMDFKREAKSNIEACQLFADLRERIAAFPGAQAVSLASSIPLTMEGRNKTGVSQIEKFQMPPGQEVLSLDYGMISPGYFETLGVPVPRGRDFSTQDGPGAPKVMMVNETFVQRYWPNQDPIGKYVTCGYGEVREVIGVARAVKLRTIREEPVPTMFFPIAQPLESPSGPLVPKPVLLVRATGDPKAIVSLVRKEVEWFGLGPAAWDIRTLPQRVSELLTPQRMIARILNVVGLVGLLFAATGIFGIMAYEVSQRTREIGIRVALGAQRGDVRELILRKGALLTLVGLGLGIGVSLVPMWFLTVLIPEIRKSDDYFLYGVHVWDPLPYACAALVLMLVALAASWIPARRAAKLDPMVALRYE